ncbi:unnamed protein product [Discosporangium mesarthrocarpum]
MKQRGGKPKRATLDIVVNKSREERLKEGIADFVIVDQQPLGVVEEQTFRRLLCIAANKDDLKLPGRRALRALILARKAQSEPSWGRAVRSHCHGDIGHLDG